MACRISSSRNTARSTSARKPGEQLALLRREFCLHLTTSLDQCGLPQLLLQRLEFGFHRGPDRSRFLLSRRHDRRRSRFRFREEPNGQLAVVR
jgi:hypothetical protein